MKTISADELNVEILRRKYVQLLTKPDVFPSKSNWEFIIEKNLQELSHLLYQKFLIASSLSGSSRKPFHIDTISMFPVFLSCIDREIAIDTLYGDTSTNPSASIDLAIRLNLFDIDCIYDLIDHNEISVAAQMLMAMKPSYNASDIDELYDLLDEFHNLPKLGRYEDSFLRSRQYICPKGHSNNDEVDFCTHEDCGLNIQGLTSHDVECINSFSERIKILDELLSPEGARE